MGVEEAMDQLLRFSPPPRIVIVTMHDDPRLVRELFGRGASSYLVKSASLKELIAAVRTAAEAPASSHVENVVMVVPPEAFKRHLANLYPKMGVGSRGEATRKALSEGWISARDVTTVEERGVDREQGANSGG